MHYQLVHVSLTVEYGSENTCQQSLSKRSKTRTTRFYELQNKLLLGYMSLRMDSARFSLSLTFVIFMFTTIFEQHYGQAVGQGTHETSISFPLLNVVESSTSSVVLTAHSTYRDRHGVDHNLTWHTTVSMPDHQSDGPLLLRSISDSVKCLHGIKAHWVNLTISPVEFPSEKTNQTKLRPPGNGTRKDDAIPKVSTAAPTTSSRVKNTTTTHNVSGPSQCDAVERYSKSDSLTIPLTSNETSDLEGIKFTELDAHKLESVANYTVRKHNCLRTRVSPSAGNMLRMEWSQEAADQAQDWADQCSYNHNNETNRTTALFPCGQNIAYTTPWAFSWNAVINMWFNEYSEYKYGEPNDLHTVGHYTAITWATTYQLGCAYKDCGGWHFYVCHYCPNGNFGDLSAPYKAGHPCEFCPDTCDRGLCTNSCPHTNIYSNCDELERKFKICSNKFQERLAVNCKATCLCPGSIYL